jgi:hypothetical protein
MTRFVVKGPYEVTVQVNKGGKAISPAEVKAFWKKYASLSAEKGCYIFGMRASKGIKPLYVGKATKTFGREIFTSDKLAKYMIALSQSKKGTPVLFFLCTPKTKGVVNKRNVDELESFLIQTGMKAYPGLLNDKKTKIEGWSIGGVLRDGKGKPTKAAQEFKRLMGL